MKKIIFTLSAIIISVSIYGQELTQDTSKKEFNNVIGLNITGLLNQIRYYYPYDYNQYPYYYNIPSQYIITYKRIYKKSAIRFGIGGMISNNSSTNNDTIDSDTKSGNINIGVGYEHYGYISKKWTFYYGIDIIGNYNYSDYQYEYSANTISKETSTTIQYGASPLFGLIFRFNKRISIATETSYDIMYTQTKRENSYSNNPNNKSNYKSTGVQTQFNAPTAFIIRIQF